MTSENKTLAWFVLHKSVKDYAKEKLEFPIWKLSIKTLPELLIFCILVNEAIEHFVEHDLMIKLVGYSIAPTISLPSRPDTQPDLTI